MQEKGREEMRKEKSGMQMTQERKNSKMTMKIGGGVISLLLHHGGRGQHTTVMIILHLVMREMNIHLKNQNYAFNNSWYPEHWISPVKMRK